MKHNPPPLSEPVFCVHKWDEATNRFLVCQKCSMTFDIELGEYSKTSDDLLFFLGFTGWFYRAGRRVKLFWATKILRKKVPN